MGLMEWDYLQWEFYPLVKSIENDPVEIVDFPIENGDSNTL